MQLTMVHLIKKAPISKTSNFKIVCYNNQKKDLRIGMRESILRSVILGMFLSFQNSFTKFETSKIFTNYAGLLERCYK